MSCFEEADLDDVESSAVTCADYTANLSCIHGASEFECFENDACMAYWVCFLVIIDCPVEEITGAGKTDADSAVVEDDDGDGEGDVGSDEGAIDDADSTASAGTAYSATAVRARRDHASMTRSS